MSSALRKIAVCQMCSGSDIGANVEAAAKMVREARRKGAVMAFLPENCAFIGTSHDQSQSIAAPVDGALVMPFRNLAKETGMWLSLGGVQETSTELGKVHNTSVIIDSDGNIRAHYRKVHLFDAPFVGLHESKFTSAGAELVTVANSPAGTLGLSVCYDLRFAALYSSLRRMGAQVLLVPSAFTVPTGKAHWEVLLRSRAIETQCYVVAAAQWGKHNEKRESWGHSMVVDPWGNVIGELEAGVGVFLCDINLAYIDEVRQRIPVQAHQRPDVYAKTGSGIGGTSSL